jgi:cation diffusion facilitator CzcD-associated flavoprotein CzcO
MAIKLRKINFDDFLILEKASDVGGTWRDNTYPGAECDVPSPVYSFSFFKNPSWSKLFGGQSEIYDYLRLVAHEFKIYKHIQFGTEVIRAEFVEHQAIWRISTAAGQIIESQFLILGTGGLSRPSFPVFPGQELFKGTVFHTARWNHDISLEGLNVGVIGTGASGIQVAPAIAQEVGHLKIFQRTPPWILPKPTKKFGNAEHLIFAKFPVIQGLLRTLLYWIFEVRAIGLIYPKLVKRVQGQAKQFIKKSVKNPLTAEQLTPNYVLGCKRVLLSNNYYEIFNKPHVALVTSGIERFYEKGLVTKDGTYHTLDAIVFATGFQVTEQGVPFPILGLGGQSLEERWQRHGAEAYRGSSLSGFPNAFVLMGPNTGLGHNSMVYMIEAQIDYIAQALQVATEEQVDFIDVKESSQSRYNQEIQSRFKGTVWAEGGCKSWYQTSKGKIVALWPGFSFTFRKSLRFFDREAYNFVNLKKTDSQKSSNYEKVI